ncbi:MAG: N-formylglutamate amidohydrolase [Gemmataceae bacterium]|nr:N-formylglutamate amidohydrolase [Gemmataceae bacterium]MDW8242561.1 N-formylglutamate amidohydrolase [Thermogemmata sp.]
MLRHWLIPLAVAGAAFPNTVFSGTPYLPAPDSGQEYGSATLSTFRVDETGEPLTPAVLQRLVTVEPGTLPVVFSVPHGGSQVIPHTSPRRGLGLADFQTVRDGWTIELATACAAEMEGLLKGRPWLIIAQADRQYVDVNRPPERAYESPNAQAVYRRYHQSVAAACQQVRQRWGSGLLLDLHGQGEFPEAICRGTLNGQTVRLLLDRHGWAALTGKRGLLGYLQRQGYKTLPDCSATTQNREVPHYRGGYIVTTYGSHTDQGLDAVQLEIGIRLREQGRWKETARDLANAIALWLEEFLPTNRH